MEKLIEAAATAWNPIGEVRRRIEDGTLTVSSVLVPVISIIIVCNFFHLEANIFFDEVITHVTGLDVSSFMSTYKNPITNSDFAQQFMLVIRALAPPAAVSLLPQSAFDPPGRSSTVATMLVVFAAMSFYGAAITGLLYFFVGLLIMVNPDLGVNLLYYLSIVAVIAVYGLTLFFWLRITLTVLSLRCLQVAVISFVAITSAALLFGFFRIVAKSVI